MRPKPRIVHVDRLMFPHFSGVGIRPSCEATARSRRSRRRSVALGVGIAELAAITPMSYGCFMPLSAPLHKLKTNWASEIPNWKRITLLGYSFSRCDSDD